MKSTLSDSGRVPPELPWTVWFGGFFSRPIVRNNLAGLAEVMMVLHLWCSGASFMLTVGAQTWTSMALLIGGFLWLTIARKMRQKFALMDAERDRFLKSIIGPPNTEMTGAKRPV